MKLVVILFLAMQLSLASAQSEGADFEMQKGYWICPSVKIENGRERAVCVYDGEVVSVLYNKGFNHAVLIRHGNYFTVYSGLDKTDLENGDQIKKDQLIGETSSKDTYKINFEVWRGKEKLNPTSWVSCLN